jgi:hypothetical protein
LFANGLYVENKSKNGGKSRTKTMIAIFALRNSLPDSTEMQTASATCLGVSNKALEFGLWIGTWLILAALRSKVTKF